MPVTQPAILLHSSWLAVYVWFVLPGQTGNHSENPELLSALLISVISCFFLLQWLEVLKM